MSNSRDVTGPHTGRRSVAGFTHGVTEPASRFRFIQYRTWLEDLGWSVTHFPCRPPRPWNISMQAQPWQNVLRRCGHEVRKWNRWKDIQCAGQYDVIFLNRDLLNGDPAWEARLLKTNPRVIFDFDDAVYSGLGAKHAEWMSRHAAWITAGNETLAAWARQFTECVTVIPTVVNVNAYAVAAPTSSPIRIGWCGSAQSINQNLMPIIPMLARLQKRFEFDMIIMTNLMPEISASELKWSYVEWSEDKEQKLGSYFDIGIMPLPDLPFNHGKCGLKLIQYMSCGLPVIASPLGVNAGMCGNGQRGITAATEPEWENAIQRLTGDVNLRMEMGRNGRAYCERHYNIKTWAPILSDIMSRVSGHQ